MTQCAMRRYVIALSCSFLAALLRSHCRGFRGHWCKPAAARSTRLSTRTLELSGGSQAVVAVLPQACAKPDAGGSSVAM
jgi:hypothetical protein